MTKLRQVHVTPDKIKPGARVWFDQDDEPAWSIGTCDYLLPVESVTRNPETGACVVRIDGYPWTFSASTRLFIVPKVAQLTDEQLAAIPAELHAPIADLRASGFEATGDNASCLHITVTCECDDLVETAKRLVDWARTRGEKHLACWRPHTVTATYWPVTNCASVTIAEVFDWELDMVEDETGTRPTGLF